MRQLLASRIGAVGILAMSAVLACSPNDDGASQQPTESTVGGAASTIAGGSGAVSSASKRAAGGSSSRSSAGGAGSIGAKSASGGSESDSGSNEAGGAVGGRAASTGADGGGSESGGAGDSDTGGRSTASSTAAGGTDATGGRSRRSTSSGGSATGGRATGGAKAAGGSSTGGKATGASTPNGGSSVGGTSAALVETGGNTGADGCSDSLALGVTISEIAVFQSGKISLMKSGAATNASTKYGADVIEGRPTVFRIYVTADSGFQSRQLSARLTLAGNSTPYYATQTISGSSTELSTANSFMISVPASAITSGLSYSVEIVECETGSGTAHSPRFPESGTTSIVTAATGVINLTLVPVTANNITPDLDSVSAKLKKHLEAVYPTTAAEITVASSPLTGCGITPSTAADPTVWSKCLTLVRNRRSADKPASNVYYMGVVTPASSYASYCGRACIGGIGYVATSASTAIGRAAISIGFDNQELSSIVHELGHNHGLKHSPGCGADDADSAFPYVTSGVAHVGWVGWDNRAPTKLLDPAKYTDLMAYCEPVWVSDYVYDKLADRIAALNRSAMLLGANAVSTWRVLDVIGGIPSWGPPVTDPIVASGEPVSGTVYDATGNALLEVTVYRSRISHTTGAMYLVPEPHPSWATLRIESTTVAF